MKSETYTQNTSGMVFNEVEMHFDFGVSLCMFPIISNAIEFVSMPHNL